MIDLQGLSKDDLMDITEISEFESHLKAILTGFVQSVALAENTEVRIRDEYARRLESKDELIQGLQADLKVEKSKAAEVSEARLKVMKMEGDYAQAMEDIATLQERSTYLQNQIEQIEQSKLTMERLLTSRLEAADAKVAEADALRAERDHLAAQLKEQARDHEIAMERAARSAEKDMDAAVAAVKAELKEAIVAGAKGLQEAEKIAHEKAMAMQAEIRKLEKEKAELREAVAKLEAK